MTSTKLLLVRSEEVATEETESAESKKCDLNDLTGEDFVRFIYLISQN